MRCLEFQHVQHVVNTFISDVLIAMAVMAISWPNFNTFNTLKPTSRRENENIVIGKRWGKGVDVLDVLMGKAFLASLRGVSER